MRVALVHDWLVAQRGGEKVLEGLCNIFPDSDIFTLMCDKSAISPQLAEKTIKTSFIQELPFSKKRFRHYLALFPMAMESFDFRGYDLIVSTSHCVGKGAMPPQGAKHVCYCFTPMRYAWCFYSDYFSSSNYGFISRKCIAAVMHYLRIWDIASCPRVDSFACVSKAVSEKIKSIYKRESHVVYPPVDTDYFQTRDVQDDFFLIVSALTPYKRVDLAVSTFNKTGLPLKIIGTGPEYERLNAMARDNVELPGGLSDEEVRDHYQRCRALIFPGEEEFGIVAAEAQSCGRPLVAFGRGGVTEIVRDIDSNPDNGTAVLFHEQTPESLAAGVRKLDTLRFSPDIIRDNAIRFSSANFEKNMAEHVDRVLME